MAILLQASLNESPVTATDSAKWTKVDPVLARVARYVSQGWPIKPESETLDYFRIKDQLILRWWLLFERQSSCGPKCWQKAVTTRLAQGTPRDDKNEEPSKVLCLVAKMDLDIEKCVKACDQCQRARPDPPHVALHPWE